MNLFPLQFYFHSETPAGRLKIGSKTGQAVHIWGPSGAGKSTLLSRIWGSRRIGAGSLKIHLQGHALDLGAMPPARFAFVRSTLMTYVAQHPTALPRARMSDWFAHAPQAKLREYLEHLDLSTSLLHRYAADLSGGELRRFLLLRAFLCRAPILLLDEPCTGLDPERHHRVVMLLQAAKNDQKLVIHTSHTPETWVDQSIGLIEQPRAQKAPDSPVPTGVLNPLHPRYD